MFEKHPLDTTLLMFPTVIYKSLQRSLKCNDTTGLRMSLLNRVTCRICGQVNNSLNGVFTVHQFDVLVGIRRPGTVRYYLLFINIYQETLSIKFFVTKCSSVSIN